MDLDLDVNMTIQFGQYYKGLHLKRNFLAKLGGRAKTRLSTFV